MVGAKGDIIGPEHFIPAAERYGLAPDIDRWVIRSALRQHRELFGANPETQLAINLSGKSLAGDGLLRYVLKELEHSGIPPNSVCFEVTETATIQNLTHAQRFIEGIRRCGCQLALDDFGSGLSSFAYLQNLKIDYLKIDGSFVRHIAEDNVALGMVRAINDVGRIMTIKTIAEFTESAAILDRLRSLGVDYAQGYHVGKPLPAQELFA
jgi:Amt family ammonium transporter